MPDAGSDDGAARAHDRGIVRAGVIHQELYSLFITALQLPLTGLPEEARAAFVELLEEAARTLNGAGVAMETAAPFRRGGAQLKSRAHFGFKAVNSDAQLAALMDESQRTASQLDRAMGAVREALPVADHAAYALGIVAAGLGFSGRQVLHGPRVFAGNPEDSVVVRMHREVMLRQSAGSVRSIREQISRSGVRLREVPSTFAQRVYKTEGLVPERPPTGLSTIGAIIGGIDEAMKFVGYASLHEGLFKELRAMYDKGQHGLDSTITCDRR